MYKYGTIEFIWDNSKELLNLKKHKVSFTDAAETFLDTNGVQVEDHEHSKYEKRSFWIGKNAQNRILTTWFTMRDNQIRIIGCAEWRKFRKLYESAKTQNDENK